MGRWRELMNQRQLRYEYSGANGWIDRWFT